MSEGAAPQPRVTSEGTDKARASTYAFGTAHSAGVSSESGVYSTRSGRCFAGTANTVFPRTQSPGLSFASYGYSGLGKSSYVVLLGSMRAPSA